MKRKDYLKPTMEVVKCESTVELLAASSKTRVSATMNSTWEEEDIDE